MTSRPRGRPPLPRDRQRQRLLDAAGRVLLRTDVASASVKEIVAEAGMSSRSFYEFFGSKDALILELVEANSSVFLAGLGSIFSEGAGDPGQMIDVALDAYLGVLAPLVAVDQKHLGHTTRERVTALRDQGLASMMDLVLGRLEDARAAGVVKRVPERAALEVVLLGIEGVTLRYGREGRLGELGTLKPVFRRLFLDTVGLP